MSKRLFISLIAFMGLTLSLSAEDRVLLVGVGDYINLTQGDGDLPGIDKDIQMMKQVAGWLGFKDNQIKILTDHEATRNNIIKSIESWLINGVSGGDRIFFYFSGHGSQVADNNNDEKDGMDELLVPADVARGNGTINPVFLDDSFGELLARIPTENVYIFIDACHSGTATKKLILYSKDYSEKLLRYPGMPSGTVKGNFAPEGVSSDKYVALAAAADNETSIATGGGSLFTVALYNSVKKANANRNLTLNQLLQETTAEIERTARRGSVHHPQLSGNAARFTENIFKGGTSSVQTSTSGSSNWKKMEEIVSKANYSLNTASNQKAFNVGDRLELRVDIPSDGYVNVISVGTDDQVVLLFPNKWQTDNFIRAGNSISIPSGGAPFVLKAQPPAGDSLVAVVHSVEPLNLFNNSGGKLLGYFKELDNMQIKVLERGFGVYAADKMDDQDKKGYGAAKLILEVR